MVIITIMTAAFAFLDALFTSVSMHCPLTVLCLCLGYGLAPRLIIRGRAPILPLQCSVNLSVSSRVDACCILQDFGSFLLQFYVALLKQGLLCWHSGHLGMTVDGTVDSHVYTAVCLFSPSFYNTSGPGDSIHTAKSIFFFLSLFFPLSTSNTTCCLFVCVAKSLRCGLERMMVSVFQNLLS